MKFGSSNIMGNLAMWADCRWWLASCIVHLADWRFRLPETIIEPSGAAVVVSTIGPITVNVRRK